MSGSSIPANAPYVRSDYTAQTAAAYKARLDGGLFTFERLALAFAPSATSPASLKVQLQAGFITGGAAALASEVASQQTAALTAPVSNPRKDLVYIDAATGAVGVAAGAESGSPADPTVPAGKLPVARITWTVGALAIANSMLEDVRSLYLMDPTTARGDVIVRKSTGLAALALGASGTVLGSDGVDVKYITPPSISTVAKSADFQASQTDGVLYVVSDTAVCTAPDAEASGGSPTGVAVNFRFGVKNQTDGKSVTVIGYHVADTFDGVSDDGGSPTVPIAIRVPGRETIWFIKDAAGSWTIEKRPSHEVGDVKEWGTNTLPVGGWAWVNGQTLSRTTYGGLFGVWGVTYGAGDGSTTFGVRDDRGRVKAGKDTMGSATAASRLTTGGSGVDGATLGANGGAETHTLTTAQLASHNHANGVGSQGGSNQGCLSGFTFDATIANTGNAGSGNAHQNTQPTIVTNFIVKT